MLQRRGEATNRRLSLWHGHQGLHDLGNQQLRHERLLRPGRCLPGLLQGGEGEEEGEGRQEQSEQDPQESPPHSPLYDQMTKFSFSYLV
jgi:hypothetical protein